jgi:hypothetical protein
MDAWNANANVLLWQQAATCSVEYKVFELVLHIIEGPEQAERSSEATPGWHQH